MLSAEETPKILAISLGKPTVVQKVVCGMPSSRTRDHSSGFAYTFSPSLFFVRVGAPVNETYYVGRDNIKWGRSM